MRRAKPTAAELRKLYRDAESNGAGTDELDKKFGKSLWFISLQCPGFSEFRHEYADESGRQYMHLEDDRWGVRIPIGTKAPFPDIADQLVLIKKGTAEEVHLKVDQVEQPAPGRRATRTLVCTPN
jgi:hypothetical protein